MGLKRETQLESELRRRKRVAELKVGPGVGDGTKAGDVVEAGSGTAKRSYRKTPTAILLTDVLFRRLAHNFGLLPCLLSKTISL